MKSDYLITLFGRLNWNKPVWLTKTAHHLRQKPIQLYTLIVLIILIAAAGFIANYYLNLPKPALPSAKITLGNIPAPSEKEEEIPLLSVQFIKPQRDSKNPPIVQSVAPLASINKEISTGIKLTPALPGTWYWVNDSELTFTPTKPWPPGQTYTLEFDRAVFSSKTRLETYHFSFTTKPLKLHVDDLKLYQNPKDPTDLKIIATVSANYPLDEKDLSKQISLVTQQIDNKTRDVNAPSMPLTVTLGKHHRMLYIHSGPLTLNQQAQYKVLVLSNHIKSSLGGSALSDSVMKQILLPDQDSMLAMKNVKTAIAYNTEGAPEQVLAIHSTIGVAPAQLKKAVHAFILPKDYPATKHQAAKPDYQWQSAEEVTPAILQEAKPLPLMLIPSDQPFPTLNSYRYQLPPNQFIYLYIDQGLAGFGNYRLKNTYRTILRAPEYPQEIRFLHKGSLLALGSEPKLSVLVRGIDAVKFEVNRVLPDEINHLISQTGGDFNDPYFINYYFSQNDISQLFSVITQFNAALPNEIQYTALDLEKYLTNQAADQSPLGLFLITGKSWDIKNNIETGVKKSRLVLVTDMGLIVKNNLDGSHDVFVQSIQQGTPIANVAVQILGRNGLPIASGTTTEGGHAHIPSVSQFTQNQEPIVIVARNQQDVSFIPFQKRDRELNYSRFDIDGINDDETLSSLSAYVFSDRGIYRPGDLIHFGMIIKKAYARAVNAGIPLEAILSDPLGKTVLEKKLTLNNDGFLSLDYLSNENLLTGNYTLSLYIIKDNLRYGVLGTTSVRIAEFLPDLMKITSRLSVDNTSGWVLPDKLGAHILLQNLVGTKAPARKVTGKLVLVPEVFKFTQYPGYIFNDPLIDTKKTRRTITEDLPETKTNEEGEAWLAFNLAQYEKGTYKLSFYAEGFAADSGRSVSAQNTVLVSPLPYLIGYKSAGDLHFIKQNSPQALNFIAINNQLAKIAVPTLTLQLFQQNKIVTLIEKEDGTYQYDTVLQEKLISTNPLNIDAEGLQYTLPTDKVGQYVLAIMAADGSVLSRVHFNVVGATQQNLQKNAELTLKLDKTIYNPGDSINLQISAPYTGSGLITLERDKTFAYKWFTLTTTNSLESITIPKSFVGNGYVNVTFVRDWNSPDIFINPLSYSVAPFQINTAPQNINIALAIPAKAKPGQLFPIQYSTALPSKMIIYAVDEGILQAAQYHTPDPLAYFFQKRALSVSTTQIVDMILPKYLASRERMSVGGDGGTDLFNQYLNPFKRKSEQPVVFWSGIIEASDVPQTLNYLLPDYFNGSLHVMAVAVNQDAVGSQEQSALVQSDFILMPNMPTMVAPGDTFEVSVNVTNNIANSQQLPITLTLESSPGLTVLSEKIKIVTLDFEKEQTVHFTLQASEVLGNATLKFKAAHETSANYVETTTSIRPMSPYETTILSGVNQDRHNSIALSRKLYPEQREQTLTADDNPKIFIQGLNLYLESYPYGCTEQVVSKGLGFISLPTTNAMDEAALLKKLNDTLQVLNQRHTSQGGFLYWPGMTQDTPDSQFSSIYALHFLTEARDKGYAVGLDLLASGLDYLKDFMDSPIANLDDARLKAYAIYILTRNDIITTNYLTHLQLYLEDHESKVWHQDITSSFIAATYQLLKNEKMANQLISGYQLTNNNEDATSNPFFSVLSQNALHIFLLAKHFPDRFLTIGNQSIAFLANSIASNQVDTTSAAYNILALSTYQPNLTVSAKTPIKINEILLNHQSTLLPNTFPSSNLVPLSPQIIQLDFINPDQSTYFYQIVQRGFDKDVSTSAISQGLEVEREYRVNNAVINGSVSLGTDMTVHLKIRALDDAHYDHIAIVDLLPGGFELIPDSFQGNYNYLDAREDRVVFFASVDTEVKEIIYHIKPIAKGDFAIPPLFAENMYNQRIMAKSIAARIQVE